MKSVNKVKLALVHLPHKNYRSKPVSFFVITQRFFLAVCERRCNGK